MKITQLPLLYDVKDVKEFFLSSINGIFTPFIHVQSNYREGDIVSFLKNAVSRKEYIETYTRNNMLRHMSSSDTIFRRIKDTLNNKCNKTWIDTFIGLIDTTINIAISSDKFNNAMDAAIDEHDIPYYGKGTKRFNQCALP